MRKKLLKLRHPDVGLFSQCLFMLRRDLLGGQFAYIQIGAINQISHPIQGHFSLPLHARVSHSDHPDVAVHANISSQYGFICMEILSLRISIDFFYTAVRSKKIYSYNKLLKDYTLHRFHLHYQCASVPSAPQVERHSKLPLEDCISE